MRERKEPKNQVVTLESVSDAELVNVDGGYTATDDLWQWFSGKVAVPTTLLTGTRLGRPSNPPYQPGV